MKEYRELHFSNHEILEALRIFRTRDKEIPDSSEIMSISLKDNPDVTIAVQYNTANTEGMSEMELPGPFIAAMMLSYCIHKKVPIPKSAQKNLSLSDGSLVMSFKV